MEVTLGMATIPERKETLERVLDSLCTQVDKIYLALNGFYIEGVEWYPVFLDKYKNVEYFWTDNSMGDAEKFRYVDKCKDYYVTWDDDLVCGIGLINRLIRGVEKYDGVCGYHGRNYPTPFVDFRKWSANYRCLGTVLKDVPCDFIGSGCTAFHTDRLKLSYTDFKLPNIGDCLFNRVISSQNIPKTVLRHFKGDIVYTNPRETIWRSTRNFDIQTAILKDFLK